MTRFLESRQPAPAKKTWLRRAKARKDSGEELAESSRHTADSTGRIVADDQAERSRVGWRCDLAGPGEPGSLQQPDGIWGKRPMNVLAKLLHRIGPSKYYAGDSDISSISIPHARAIRVREHDH
jgi:hypothetical protein